jgi:hypothetical protein
LADHHEPGGSRSLPDRQPPSGSTARNAALPGGWLARPYLPQFTSRTKSGIRGYPEARRQIPEAGPADECPYSSPENQMKAHIHPFPEMVTASRTEAGVAGGIHVKDVT